ncbi:NADH-quinone oxidoreductase subunit M [Congregibacter sp.]|uniref:NADH-quinone oxidoreductase subunit M n=1 Tax=Congregibacter sp. TaxID=2744308 RepID=UPI0039E4A5A7
MNIALLVMLPLLGGLIAWQSERVGVRLPRWITVGTLLLTLAYLAGLIADLPGGRLALMTSPVDADTWLLHSKFEWIPRFGISFELALDGLSLLMLVLTLLLGLIAVASSWSEVDFRPGFFQANLLWTVAGVIGVFLALDLLLFFLFWEVMLIPMYLLIAIWGHESRSAAAMKFFIFTQASGLLMLAAIVGLAFASLQNTGVMSFSYFDLLLVDLGPRTAFWLMLGFFIAFTVKLPIFPFHTWLPDAHTQAPTAGSVLLAGILLKTGAYGLLRFCLPLFPEASQAIAPIAIILGVAGIIYGALLAFAQTDFKRLVAYSSVSHMGFVMLGIYALNDLGTKGAVMQMVAHGVSTAALFMLAGALQHRLHSRDMRQMGGLWHNAPRMGACAMFFALASLGLPGLGNFVAEFLVLLGLFTVDPWMTALAAVGMITAAIYSLWMLQQAFLGQADEQREFQDFGSLEMATMGAMMLGLLWLGLYPQPVFDLVQPVLQGIYASMQLTSVAVLP